jgi:hypothetical protein
MHMADGQWVSSSRPGGGFNMARTCISFFVSVNSLTSVTAAPRVSIRVNSTVRFALTSTSASFEALPKRFFTFAELKEVVEWWRKGGEGW